MIHRVYLLSVYLTVVLIRFWQEYINCFPFLFGDSSFLNLRFIRAVTNGHNTKFILEQSVTGITKELNLLLPECYRVNKPTGHWL